MNREEWVRDGYALLPSVASGEELAGLTSALAEATAEAGMTGAGSRRGGSVYALRNVLALPAVRDFVQNGPLLPLVREVLGPEAITVRGILFDKTPDANWPVPWHQDLSIAVRERADLPGWGPWSEKAGVVHVQPPVTILEQMVTTRLHLDDCGPENGPLLVLPGTHLLGRLTAPQIADAVAYQSPVVCKARGGDLLLMRPLLLHASGKSTVPGHRRVLHIEWANAPLTGSLRWNEVSEV